MAEAYAMDEEEAPAEQGPLHVLDMVEMDNVADQIKDDVLMQIGGRVLEEVEIDRATMKDWLDMNQRALELVEQKYEVKSDPFDGAANTKLPLVLDAIMRAHAEEMPEIIRDDELVKAKVFGKVTDEKTARAERVTKRLNYHFFYGIEDWEEDHDAATLAKNTLGVVHKKMYWCKEEGRYIAELKTAGVIINDNVRHLRKAPRITDTLTLPWWEVEEKFRAGTWRRIEMSEEMLKDSARSDKMHTFYEQIRREDLDEDGYPEPYVVTVHERSRQVVCIAPNYTFDTIWFQQPPQGPQDRPPVIRIEQDKGRVQYIKYEMIPSVSGGYWGWGFGRILGPLNDNANALVNQLLDAGSLSNVQGGFISSALRIGKGPISFQRGEWKTVNALGAVLKDSIVPLPVREPSATLFNLLGLLTDVLRQTSGISQLMSGEQPRANMPASSILALLEQGKKAFGQIYKRHRRALKREATALYTLCFMYEDPQEYAAFFDEEQQDPKTGEPLPPPDPQADFNPAGVDLLPTAQPEFSTRVQRVAQSEALLNVSGDPRVNGSAILKMFVGNLTNDKDLAAEIVPAEPNKTPEQVMQAMEIAKKELLNQLDVQIKQAEAGTAMYTFEMKKLDAEVKGITAPMAVAKAEHGAIRSSLQVEAAGVTLDTRRVDLKIKQQEANAPEDDGQG